MASCVRRGWTERVIYRPGKPGLAPREIDALVERVGPEQVMSGQAMGIHVTALNDAVDGIPTDPSLSDVGTDALDVAERRGGPLVSRSIQRFLQADDPELTTVLVI
jgi:hypothetical protein